MNKNTMKNFIIHSSYHKAGTKLFEKILIEIAKKYNKPLNTEMKNISCNDIFLDLHSDFYKNKIYTLIPLTYKGTHMLRDPRDIIVSAYFYHQWSDEEWINRKIINEQPLKKYLKTCSIEEGLISEIHLLHNNIQNMYNWNYNNNKFLEIKYENIIYDDVNLYEKIFNHYEIKSEDIDYFVNFALQNKFQNITNRKLCEIKNNKHTRSGIEGQWKKYFTNAVKSTFKLTFGDILVKTKYEDDNNW